jgi:hypothetical protein
MPRWDNVTIIIQKKSSGTDIAKLAAATLNFATRELNNLNVLNNEKEI